MRKIVLGVLGSVVACVVIALIVLYGCVPLATPSPSSNDVLKGYVISLKDEIRNHMTITLEVYKNEELVRRKVGDPISDQWLKLVANYLLGMESYLSISWLNEGGSTVSVWGTEVEEGNPVPKLAIGTGLAAYPSDNSLVSKVMEATLNSNYITVTDTGTQFQVRFAYTFVVSDAYNISEAGLFVKDKGGGSDYGWVLICHDTFTPVSLQANDGITIEYTFVVDYSTPPFLKKFWELLLDYFMGLRGAGCPVGTTRIDVGDDYWDGYSYKDNLKEKLTFAYVLSDTPWSPEVAPTVSSKWSIRNVVQLITSNQKLSLYMVVIQGNTQESYTVYGIMFYLYTDTDAANVLKGTYVPIAYVRFSEAPVSVDYTSFFEVNLTVSFNQS